jgi:universal stress protein E
MTIVCATDRLPKSEVAIERAGILADRLSADILLLHIVVPGVAARALEETLLAAHAGMKARAQPPLWRSSRLPEIAVRTGNPGRLILQTMEHSDARLLVLGRHRKRPLRDTLEGTIAEKAIAARRCPVLIVQNEAHSPYARALLALDLSAASASALRAAELLVLEPDADAQIVHAQESSYEEISSGGLHSGEDGGRSSESEAREALRDTFEGESADFARYQVRIEPHEPPVAILRAVELFKPDILVMGTRGGGRLHRALLGSVANRILHEATCDTLIVPEGSVGQGADRTADRRVLGGTSAGTVNVP